MSLQNFEFFDLKPVISSVEDDILTSLKKTNKRLSPKYFYDETGSKLFTEICELPEYYPTRTEIGILKENIKDISETLGDSPMIVEFGSGASEKIKYILSSTLGKTSYLAMDISKEFLIESSKIVAKLYPEMNVYALCADYSKKISLPKFTTLRNNKVLYFPGSSFGNFDKNEQTNFLTNARKMLSEGESFLIGLDLIKKTPVLNDAYNDSKGITAKFNLNILSHINKLTGSSFDLNSFKHVAFYNEELNRIEMHIESLDNQSISILGEEIFFEKGERIHTENSYKFNIDYVKPLFFNAGFELNNVWTDSNNYFGMFYFKAV